jgi:hypothetical protein
MAGQSIDNVFAKILKDCQAVAVEAVKNAAKKTQNDIVKEAKNYLQKYYSNYSPKRYKRTYRLKRAILPFWADKGGKGNISVEVGVQYDSSALKGAYKSNSQFHQSGDAWREVTDHSHITSDNGIPEPDWIMNNFLEGIHPWAQTDTESTNSLMEEFFDTQLPSRIERYVQEELFNAIVKRL